MQTKHVFLILVAAVLITACRKKAPPQPSEIYPSGKVEGYIVDKTTQKRLPYATVYLQSKESDCVMCQPGNTKAYQADQNGWVSFDYKFEKGYFSNFAAQADDMYFTAYEWELPNFRGAGRYTWGLVPKAYVKFHVKNVAPFDNQDRMNISLYCSIAPTSFLRTQVDTVFDFCPQPGNKENEIRWVVYKNGGSEVFTKLVFTPAFDTTLIQIFY